MEKQITLSASEWPVMEALWEAPRTLMELVRELAERVGWAKSTVTTMIRRMEEKKLIRFELQGRTKCFYPAVSRGDVVAQETETLLQRAYHGSVGMLLSAMVERNSLSHDEIDELYDILRQAEAKK